MTIQDEHTDRIIRLLKKDAERRNYIRDYMKEYRAKKKLETGKDRNNTIHLKLSRAFKEHHID